MTKLLCQDHFGLCFAAWYYRRYLCANSRPHAIVKNALVGWTQKEQNIVKRPTLALLLLALSMTICVNQVRCHRVLLHSLLLLWLRVSGNRGRFRCHLCNSRCIGNFPCCFLLLKKFNCKKLNDYYMIYDLNSKKQVS